MSALRIYAFYKHASNKFLVYYSTMKYILENYDGSNINKDKSVIFQVMRLESSKRRWIGNRGDSDQKFQTDCSSSFDSTDDESKIRLDDPALRLNIAESPSPTYETGDLNFTDVCINKGAMTTTRKLSSEMLSSGDKTV